MSVEITNLDAGYPHHLVLNGINAQFPKGKITTIIGPNGSGKSTLLRTIARRLPILKGEISINGKNIAQFTHLEFARLLAFLPQMPNNNVNYTVEQLVSFGRHPHNSGKIQNQEIVNNAMKHTGMFSLRHCKLREISGGEQQRAYLSMTLAQQPEILLLDEPSAFLDLRHQFEIMELLSSLNRKLGLTIIMVLHDPQLAALYSHEIMVISQGKKVICQVPEQVLTPELFATVFGVSTQITRYSNGKICCNTTGLIEA